MPAQLLGSKKRFPRDALLWQGPGIELQYASNINITGNAIFRPMAAVASNDTEYSQPIDSSAAIRLDVIAGQAQVAGNLILDADMQNIPQV